jgi:peptidoglycan hydrolase-like protein with peptidoglycan-binding domain
MRLFNRTSRARKTTVAAGLTGALMATLLGGSIAIAPTAQAASTHCTGYMGPTSGVHYTQIPSWMSRDGWNAHYNCVLHQGDRGDAVRALQRALNKCYGQGLTVDGVFGPKTFTAVKNVQRRVNNYRGVNIAVDGKYGPQTRNAMQWPYYRQGVSGYKREYCTWPWGHPGQ